MHESLYPNTFYRVSLKAIIRDERGFVLCCKEADSDAWSLPGGGIDHTETDTEALTRELFEEVAFQGDFEAYPIGIDQMWVESRQAYLLWVVYEVTPAAGYTWGVGADASVAEFIDTHTFKDSARRAERLVYKWTVDRSYNPFAMATV